MPSPSPAPDPDFAELRFALARLRRERKWTLDQLAERSGVARRSIVQIESGQSNGSVATWYRLSWAFGITIGEILAPVYGPTRSPKHAKSPAG